MICRPSVSSAGSYFVIVIVSQVARLRRGIDIQFNTFSITTPAGVDEPENLVHLGAAATHANSRAVRLGDPAGLLDRVSLNAGKQGVFTNRRITRGSVVVRGVAAGKSRARADATVQIGRAGARGPPAHAALAAPASHIRHSCIPCTAPIDNTLGALDFVALRDIEVDEEITFDVRAPTIAQR
jgi:hypothetical protein